MTQEFEAWKLSSIARIKEKTAAFTDQEKEKLQIGYPEKLLEVMPRFLVTPDDFTQLQTEVETLITALPETNDPFKSPIGYYKTLVKNSRAVFEKKYNLVQKGTTQTLWLSIGISLGVTLGVVFKNVAIGILFGLGIGMSIGAKLEQQAVKENRIL
jgi:hypothetical protein